MARIGRLGGALLLEGANGFFLVGNLKQPCDFAAAGFERPPVEIDAVARPFIPLQQCGPVVWSAVTLTCDAHPALPQLLAERLLISRNGSVSERLWNLITRATPSAALPCPGDVSWLVQTPADAWEIVRDAVLRCS